MLHFYSVRDILALRLELKIMNNAVEFAKSRHERNPSQQSASGRAQHEYSDCSQRIRHSQRTVLHALREIPQVSLRRYEKRTTF